MSSNVQSRAEHTLDTDNSGANRLTVSLVCQIHCLAEEADVRQRFKGCLYWLLAVMKKVRTRYLFYSPEIQTEPAEVHRARGSQVHWGLLYVRD